MLDSRDQLAARLRDVRTDRGWTLNDLSAKSLVSKATLSRIENGEVSPNAEVLGKLCAAFEISLTRLLAPIEAVFHPLVPRDEQSIWRDAKAEFERRVVSPPNAALRSEVIECRLGAQTEITYDAPLVTGQEHHLVLFEGRLTVTVENRDHVLTPGDCLRYRLHGASAFRTAEDAAKYLLFLS